MRLTYRLCLLLDKPRYKPGQSVLINVFTLNPQMQPINVPVKLFLVDARGSRITQWNIESWEVTHGVISKEFPLSKQPVLGEWKVFAHIQSYSCNQSIVVEHYQVPKFKLDITTPSQIVSFDKKETILIDADYLFGSRLNGKVEVNYTIIGIEQYSAIKTKTLYIDDQLTNGRYAFEADIPDLVKGVEIHHNFIGKLEVNAKIVTPDGRSEEKTSDTCIVSAKDRVLFYAIFVSCDKFVIDL